MPPNAARLALTELLCGNAAPGDGAAGSSSSAVGDEACAAAAAACAAACAEVDGYRDKAASSARRLAAADWAATRSSRPACASASEPFQLLWQGAPPDGEGSLFGRVADRSFHGRAPDGHESATVVADRAFEYGVHQWEIKARSYDSEVYVGVLCEARGARKGQPIIRWPGSAFLRSNGCVYRDGGEVTVTDDLDSMREGDSVRLTLDTDAGTLRFRLLRNRREGPSRSTIQETIDVRDLLAEGPLRPFATIERRGEVVLARYEALRSSGVARAPANGVGALLGASCALSVGILSTLPPSAQGGVLASVTRALLQVAPMGVADDPAAAAGLDHMAEAIDALPEVGEVGWEKATCLATIAVAGAKGKWMTIAFRRLLLQLRRAEEAPAECTAVLRSLSGGLAAAMCLLVDKEAESGHDLLRLCDYDAEEDTSTDDDAVVPLAASLCAAFVLATRRLERSKGSLLTEEEGGRVGEIPIVSGRSGWVDVRVSRSADAAGDNRERLQLELLKGAGEDNHGDAGAGNTNGPLLASFSLDIRAGDLLSLHLSRLSGSVVLFRNGVLVRGAVHAALADENVPLRMRIGVVRDGLSVDAPAPLALKAAIARRSMTSTAQFDRLAEVPLDEAIAVADALRGTSAAEAERGVAYAVLACALHRSHCNDQTVETAGRERAVAALLELAGGHLNWVDARALAAANSCLSSTLTQDGQVSALLDLAMKGTFAELPAAITTRDKWMMAQAAEALLTNSSRRESLDALLQAELNGHACARSLVLQIRRHACATALEADSLACLEAFINAALPLWQAWRRGLAESSVESLTASAVRDHALAIAATLEAVPTAAGLEAHTALLARLCETALALSRRVGKGWLEHPGLTSFQPLKEIVSLIDPAGQLRTRHPWIAFDARVAAQVPAEGLLSGLTLDGLRAAFADAKGRRACLVAMQRTARGDWSAAFAENAGVAEQALYIGPVDGIGEWSSQNSGVLTAAAAWGANELVAVSTRYDDEEFDKHELVLEPGVFPESHVEVKWQEGYVLTCAACSVPCDAYPAGWWLVGMYKPASACAAQVCVDFARGEIAAPSGSAYAGTIVQRRAAGSDATTRARAERFTTEGLLGVRSRLKSAVIETPHKYLPNMDKKWTFEAPGADMITLTFDPRCYTEHYDRLYIYTDASMSDSSRIAKLHGSEEDWPRKLQVMGERVHLRFTSDSSVEYWGFRCEVVAHKAVRNEQLHPLTSAALSLAAAAGSVAAALLGAGSDGGEVSNDSDTDAARALLASATLAPLLHDGLAPSPCDSALIKELCAPPPLSQRASELCAVVAGDRAAASIADCAPVFGALLYHLDLVEAAERARSGAVPTELASAWRAAGSVLHIGKAQRRRNAALLLRLAPLRHRRASGGGSKGGSRGAMVRQVSYGSDVDSSDLTSIGRLLAAFVENADESVLPVLEAASRTATRACVALEGVVSTIGDLDDLPGALAGAVTAAVLAPMSRGRALAVLGAGLPPCSGAVLVRRHRAAVCAFASAVAATPSTGVLRGSEMVKSVRWMILSQKWPADTLLALAESGVLQRLALEARRATLVGSHVAAGAGWHALRSALVQLLSAPDGATRSDALKAVVPVVASIVEAIVGKEVEGALAMAREHGGASERGNRSPSRAGADGSGSIPATAPDLPEVEAAISFLNAMGFDPRGARCVVRRIMSNNSDADLSAEALTEQAAEILVSGGGGGGGDDAFAGDESRQDISGGGGENGGGAAGQDAVARLRDICSRDGDMLMEVIGQQVPWGESFAEAASALSSLITCERWARDRFDAAKWTTWLQDVLTTPCPYALVVALLRVCMALMPGSSDLARTLQTRHLRAIGASAIAANTVRRSNSFPDRDEQGEETATHRRRRARETLIALEIAQCLRVLAGTAQSGASGGGLAGTPHLLARQPSMTRGVNEELAKALAWIAAAPPVDWGRQPAQLELSIGAVCVLGGASERIRLGGPVATEDSGAQAAGVVTGVCACGQGGWDVGRSGTHRALQTSTGGAVLTLGTRKARHNDSTFTACYGNDAFVDGSAFSVDCVDCGGDSCYIFLGIAKVPDDYDSDWGQGRNPSLYGDAADPRPHACVVRDDGRRIYCNGTNYDCPEEGCYSDEGEFARGSSVFFARQGNVVTVRVDDLLVGSVTVKGLDDGDWRPICVFRGSGMFASLRLRALPQLQLATGDAAPQQVMLDTARPTRPAFPIGCAEQLPNLLRAAVASLRHDAETGYEYVARTSSLHLLRACCAAVGTIATLEGTGADIGERIAALKSLALERAVSAVAASEQAVAALGPAGCERLVRWLQWRVGAGEEEAASFGGGSPAESGNAGGCKTQEGRRQRRRRRSDYDSDEDEYEDEDEDEDDSSDNDLNEEIQERREAMALSLSGLMPGPPKRSEERGSPAFEGSGEHARRRAAEAFGECSNGQAFELASGALVRHLSLCILSGLALAGACSLDCATCLSLIRAASYFGDSGQVEAFWTLSGADRHGKARARAAKALKSSDWPDNLVCVSLAERVAKGGASAAAGEVEESAFNAAAAVLLNRAHALGLPDLDAENGFASDRPPLPMDAWPTAVDALLVALRAMTAIADRARAAAAAEGANFDGASPAAAMLRTLRSSDAIRAVLLLLALFRGTPGEEDGWAYGDEILKNWDVPSDRKQLSLFGCKSPLWHPHDTNGVQLPRLYWDFGLRSHGTARENVREKSCATPAASVSTAVCFERVPLLAQECVALALTLLDAAALEAPCPLATPDWLGNLARVAVRGAWAALCRHAKALRALERVDVPSPLPGGGIAWDAQMDVALTRLMTREGEECASGGVISCEANDILHFLRDASQNVDADESSVQFPPHRWFAAMVDAETVEKAKGVDALAAHLASACGALGASAVLQERWNILLSANAAFLQLLPLTPFGESATLSLPGRVVRRQRVFKAMAPDVRRALWAGALWESRPHDEDGTHLPAVTLILPYSRLAAVAARERCASAPDMPRADARLMLIQMVDALGQHVARFRRLKNRSQAWYVRCDGFSAIDQGGVFRDSISEVCAELCSNASPVLRLCPNGRDASGEHRDRFVLRSRLPPGGGAACEFLGALCGVAIRSQQPLNVSLARLAWRRVADHEASLADVERIDESLGRTLAFFRGLHDAGDAEVAEGALWGMTHTTWLSDGREVATRPGGEEAELAMADLPAHCAAMERLRARECDEAAAAVARGLAMVVPRGAFSLLTAEELEAEVCGRPEVSVEDLQKVAHYDSPLHVGHEAVVLLWRVLRSFTNEQRADWLRFTTGRSRLPGNLRQLGRVNIDLLSRATGADAPPLPTASTCSNAFHMPLWPDEAAARRGLATALEYSREIDAD